MWYSFLADVVVGVHLAYVFYVLFGLLAILIGLACRWEWVRNPWFRWSHLLMIVVVALESVVGMVCPLTEWEDWLRAKAGQSVEDRPEMVAARTGATVAGLLAAPGPGHAVAAVPVVYSQKYAQPTFIGRLLRDLLFFDCSFDHWGFQGAYFAVAVAIVATFVCAPPRRRKKAAPAENTLVPSTPIGS